MNLIKEINDLFQESYSNVLGVLTAAPLSKKNHSTVPSTFKEDLWDSINDIFIQNPDMKKRIRLKYETLTANSLRETMKIGCKVLYLGSMFEPKKGLAVESGESIGASEVLDYQILKELLSIQPEVLTNPNTSQISFAVRQYSIPEIHKLKVVIIDTEPDGMLRELLFTTLKVQYIVWFDGKSLQQQGYNQLLILESYKQMFVISFIQNLVSKDNALVAFKEAARDVKIFLRRSFDDEIDIARLETSTLPQLELKTLDSLALSHSTESSIKSGEKEEEAIFPELRLPTPIRLEDISLPRCSTNIPKIFLPFIGRQKELEKICLALQRSEESFIQIIGKKGSGKTRLMLEAANYIIQRNHPYEDGIYYFSCKKKIEAFVDSIRSTFSSSTQALKSLDAIFRDKKMLVIIDDYNDGAASVLQVLIDQSINTIIVTEADYEQSPTHRKKLRAAETIEIEPLKKAELSEIIEAYTGLDISQRLPNFDASDVLGKAFESLKSLLELLRSANCRFPNIERDEYQIKDAYTYYIDLDRLFEGLAQDARVIPITVDNLIYSKNSKYFKGELGTKEPEIIIDFIKPAIDLALGQEKQEEEIIAGDEDFDL